MTRSSYFARAAAEKDAKRIERDMEVERCNRELENLFVELQTMRDDFSSFFVTFCWGKSRFRADEKCIVIERRKGAVGRGSNVIEFSHGSFRAYGGPDRWNETYAIDLGKNAKESAATIARILVKDSALPASGYYDVDRYISDTGVREERSRSLVQIFVWILLGVGFVELLRLLSRM